MYVYIYVYIYIYYIHPNNVTNVILVPLTI